MKLKTFLIILLVFSNRCFADSKKFSETAWKKISPIYQKITKHPFNEELLKGTLSKERFAYYSEQDSFYLLVFAKVLAILGTKLDDPMDIQMVFGHAAGSLKERRHSDEKTARANRFTLAYTNFLLATAAYKTREELAAAVLPCFWIYSVLAEEMRQKVKEDNPYFSWIKLYASSSYHQSAKEMIALADRLAAHSSPEIVEKMLTAFETASNLEWEFWNDSYELGQHPK